MKIAANFPRWGAFTKYFPKGGPFEKYYMGGLFSTYFAWVLQQTATRSGEFAGQSHVAWKTPLVVASSLQVEVATMSGELGQAFGNRQSNWRFGWCRLLQRLQVAFVGGAGLMGSCNCNWRFECKLQLPLAIQGRVRAINTYSNISFSHAVVGCLLKLQCTQISVSYVVACLLKLQFLKIVSVKEFFKVFYLLLKSIF